MPVHAGKNEEYPRRRTRRRRTRKQKRRDDFAGLRRLPAALVRILTVIALILIAFRVGERLLFRAPEIPGPAALSVRPGQKSQADFNSNANSNLNSNSNDDLNNLNNLNPGSDSNTDTDLNNFNSNSDADLNLNNNNAPDIKSPSAPRKEKFYTFLLAGVDDGNGGSDTIIFASLDAVNKRFYGVSIPRDTKAIVNGKAYKINAAYKIGGMDLLARTVSDQFGVPVDFTIEIDLTGFSALIDAIGGVEFDVPLDMDYDDPAQNLEIHVKAGLQNLDGETALKVVRFRHNNDGSGYGNEDLGRIETQQRFLKTTAKKILSPSGVLKIDNFIQVFQRYVKTNLTVSNLAWLAREIFAIGPEHIQFSTLQGVWKSPYIYPDPDAALYFINEYFNPYQEKLTRQDLRFPT